MQEFINDFKIFFSGIFDCIISMWNWLIGTTLGEIIIFLVIISLFFFLLNIVIDFKD